MYAMHGETVHFDTRRNRLMLLDQTRLPQETVILSLSKKEEMFRAIAQLQVRGAPAIGVAAAIGLAVLANESTETDKAAFLAECRANAAYLASARPTAVNLFRALDAMLETLQANAHESIDTIRQSLTARALALHAEDVAVCQKIGAHGATLLESCKTVLTHCNAGRLATVKYGTALAPVYAAKEQGHALSVFADETRPLLQGARLTAYELCEAGIDVTVICDNMVSFVMQKGLIDAVLVGCDRVAANGDTANKIGTSGVAILAKHYDVPFYVCAPFSTIDKTAKSGADIPIELRDGSEIGEMWYREPMLPAHAKTLNPAFDITDHSLITAFITEKRILQPSDF